MSAADLARSTCFAAAVMTAWAGTVSAALSNDFRQLSRAECAIPDLRAMTIIEDHGVAEDVSNARLAEAGMLLLEARMSCSAGQYGHALALYDRILAIGPVMARR